MNPTDPQPTHQPQIIPTPAAEPATAAAIAVRPTREVRVVEDESAISYLMDTARFEHCYRIAGAMAMASLIPKHLKGETPEVTKANCFLVVNQALRWNMDPFSVAPETYEVGGKLGFQGKLVAAVINTRAGLAEKLSYTFEGKEKTDDYTITVSGRLNGEDSPRTVTVRVGDVRTQNQIWTRDPTQKLVYTGAIKWARRHKPEVILGVLTDDDADLIKEEARVEKLRSVGPSFGRAQVMDSPKGKPEAAPEPAEGQQEPPKAVEPSVQMQLGDAIIEAGFTFDHFAAWARGSGQIPEPQVLDGFDDVTQLTAKKLLKIMPAVLKGCAEAKGAA